MIQKCVVSFCPIVVFLPVLDICVSAGHQIQANRREQDVQLKTQPKKIVTWLYQRLCNYLAKQEAKPQTLEVLC